MKKHIESFKRTYNHEKYSSHVEEYINSYSDHIKKLKFIRKHCQDDFLSAFGFMLINFKNTQINKNTLKRILITVHQEMEKNVEFWKATEHILRTVHPDEDWSLFVEILNEFKKDTFKKT